MKSQGLSFFSDVHWTTIGLVIFVTSFIVMLIIQQTLYKAEDVKKISNLPFDGEEA